MSLFISILEQKKNEEIQKIIMKFLTINRVLSSIIYTLKKYFYQNAKDDIRYNEYFLNYNEKQIEQNLFVFDYTVYDFFKNEYFEEEMPKKSDEFKLANNYYRYIKLLSIKEKSPEAEEMIKQVEKITEEESKVKFVLFNKKAQNSNEIAPIINSNKYTETKSPILNKNEAEKMKVPSKKKTKEKKGKRFSHIKESPNNKLNRKSEILNNNLNLNNENIDEILENLNYEEENESKNKKGIKKNSKIHVNGQQVSEIDEVSVNSSELSSSSVHENNEQVNDNNMNNLNGENI